MKYLIIFSVIIFLFKNSFQDIVETKEEINTESNTNVNENSNEDNNNKNDEDDVSNQFSKEWEEKMSDYEPGYVYLLPIKPKKTEKYFEEITRVPVRVRGAYLADDNNKDKVEFVILDPNNKLIYKNYTSECIFEFEAKTQGIYTIKFKNSQSKNELKITFTLNTYQKEVLSKEHLTYTDQKIEILNKFMEKIKLEGNMLAAKKKERKTSKIFVK